MAYIQPRGSALQAPEAPAEAIERSRLTGELAVAAFLRLTRHTTPAGHESNLNPLLPDWERDDAGNARIIIPLPDGTAPTWGLCAHLDDVSTEVKQVNRELFNAGGRQLIRSEGNSILGADDKSGVAIILAMVHYQIPGIYHLFISEEKGLVGSRHAAARGWGRGLRSLVALDRKGTADLVHTQLKVRCCSDAFAAELCSQLNAGGLKYKPTTGGSTDSAPFMGEVAECSNLSVGYESAHGNAEVQDLTHLAHLAQSLALVDWQRVPTTRTPTPCPDKRAPKLIGDPEPQAASTASASTAPANTAPANTAPANTAPATATSAAPAVSTQKPGPLPAGALPSAAKTEPQSVSTNALAALTPLEQVLKPTLTGISTPSQITTAWRRLTLHAPVTSLIRLKQHRHQLNPTLRELLEQDIITMARHAQSETVQHELNILSTQLIMNLLTTDSTSNPAELQAHVLDAAMSSDPSNAKLLSHPQYAPYINTLLYKGSAEPDSSADIALCLPQYRQLIRQIIHPPHTRSAHDKPIFA